MYYQEGKRAFNFLQNIIVIQCWWILTPVLLRDPQSPVRTAHFGLQTSTCLLRALHYWNSCLICLLSWRTQRSAGVQSAAAPSGCATKLSSFHYCFGGTHVNYCWGSCEYKLVTSRIRHFHLFYVCSTAHVGYMYRLFCYTVYTFSSSVVRCYSCASYWSIRINTWCWNWIKVVYML